MKRTIAPAAFLSVLLTSLPAPAAPSRPAGLPVVTPDEDVETTLAERFSLPHALACTAAMRAALLSFEQLTDEVRAVVPPPRLAAIGNTDPELQTLGFRNLPNAVEGALLLQAWQIAALERELVMARQSTAVGTADHQATVSAADSALAAADARFRDFWKSFRISD